MSQISKLVEAVERKNIIVNGGAHLYQRSLNASGLTSGILAADRFGIFRGGVAPTMQQLRSGETPDLEVPLSPFTHRHINEAPLGSVAAADFRNIIYAVEGYDIAPYRNRFLTLSFYARSSQAGTYCVALRNDNAGNIVSQVLEFTLAADTWKFVELPFYYNTDVISSLGDDPEQTNLIGLLISWQLVAGSNFQTATTDDWISGNAIATANQVNWAQSNGATFDLHGVMLNPGIKPAPFQLSGLTFDQEIRLAERYFEKSWDLDTDVGTTTVSGALEFRTPASISNAGFITFPMKTPKRAEPTGTAYNRITGAQDSARNESNSTNIPWGYQGSRGDSMMSWRKNSGGTTPSVGDDITWHYTLNAEMI